MDAQAQHKARVDKLCKQLPHRTRKGIELAIRKPHYYWQLAKQIRDCEREVIL